MQSKSTEGTFAVCQNPHSGGLTMNCDRNNTGRPPEQWQIDSCVLHAVLPCEVDVFVSGAVVYALPFHSRTVTGTDREFTSRGRSFFL